MSAQGSSNHDPLSLPEPHSAIAQGLSRIALRAMRWPGRRWVGARARQRSRGRGGRRFKVTGEDGVAIEAWYSPCEPDQPTKLPVVFSHGYMEVKELHFALADRLNARGHDVILYDHRGHGHSGGPGGTFGVKERLDLRHVIDEAAGRGYITERLATMGFSLGAATVLQHAPDDARVRGVVALAPFSDFRAAIGSFREMLAPWMDKDWLMRGFEAATRQAGFEIDASSTIDAIKRIDVPVMIVEGGKDKTLPPDVHVRPLTEACGQRVPRMFKVEDAGHGTLVHRKWPELDDAIDQFLDSLDTQEA